MSRRIRPDPSAEEAAAITAAAVVLEQEAAARAASAGGQEPGSMWVHASRRAAQRVGLQRGPWRLSGRIPRRSRT